MALMEHFILGASILSAAEPLCGTAIQLDYMVEVLTAANVMNATGENSEGIEGVSEMLEGLQKYSKRNPRGVVALPVNSRRSLLMPSMQKARQQAATL